MNGNAEDDRRLCEMHSLLRKIEDAVSRARDGLTVAGVGDLNIVYVEGQLTRARGDLEKLIGCVKLECQHNWLGGFCDLCGAIEDL